MGWKPPETLRDMPLRDRQTVAEWHAAIEEIAEEHRLLPCTLEPYERGETIVWRAGEQVIKLTAPEFAFQIEAEVGCLRATEGKLSVTTPRLRAQGKLAGWPYVIMERIEGQPITEVWPELEHRERCRLAHDIGGLCRELHSLALDGFPTGWNAFWEDVSTAVGARHTARGDQSPLPATIDEFLAEVGPLDDPRRVPLHTELIDQHIYVRPGNGRFELSALIDFADARVGPPHYDFAAPVDFIFLGERGLLREFMLAYGMREADLTPEYSQVLLAWSLCHRFANLPRTIAKLDPPTPASESPRKSRRQFQLNPTTMAGSDCLA